MKLTLAALFALAFAATRFTPSEKKAHRQWMNDAQERKEDVREALEKRDAARIRQATAELARLTAQEQRFWVRTTSRRAQELAAKNAAAARRLATLAASNRVVETAQAFEQLETSCRTCHDEHLERLPEFR